MVRCFFMVVACRRCDLIGYRKQWAKFHCCCCKYAATAAAFDDMEVYAIRDCFWVFIFFFFLFSIQHVKLYTTFRGHLQSANNNDKNACNCKKKGEMLAMDLLWFIRLQCSICAIGQNRNLSTKPVTFHWNSSNTRWTSNCSMHIPSKSPVSATIVVNAFNWSKADTLVFFVCGSLMLNVFFKYVDLRENEKLNCQSQRKILHVVLNCFWPPNRLEWSRYVRFQSR